MKAKLRIYYDKRLNFWCIKVDGLEGNYIFSCNSNLRTIALIKYFWWKNVTIRLQNKWLKKVVEEDIEL